MPARLAFSHLGLCLNINFSGKPSLTTLPNIAHPTPNTPLPLSPLYFCCSPSYHLTPYICYSSVVYLSSPECEVHLAGLFALSVHCQRPSA